MGALCYNGSTGCYMEDKRMDQSFVKNMPKLGFGLMRLPTIGDAIDIPQTCRMVDMFLEKGFL